MVSVTPDITASPSFQAPPPRAKADAPSSNDSFGALVDGNNTAAANNNDRAHDVPPPPQQSASDNRPAPS
ncbi:hypothetical protein ABTD27_19470, partial [Acinetobacter baumannii]